MKITERLVESVKHFEGFSEEAYLDTEIRRPDNSAVRIYAIGYGRTGEVRFGDVTTMEDEDLWLRAELRRIGDEVEKVVDIPMTQGQFDAFVSLAYDIGLGGFRRSILLKKFKAGNSEAHVEFGKWIHSGGKIMPGLITRRRREANWFSEGV